MEQVVSREKATAAWQAVKRNRGAVGIDRMTTKKLREHICALGETLQGKLLVWTYVPSRGRWMAISKSNGGPDDGYTDGA